ncbi:hypothetical protein [Actinomadura miaoliensis]|uniref:Uncharacterized protein n=1 Tax=Actinomadura miaoliensis TaxID=430685 RepID=A0ABP7WC91_9ACTN
MTATTYTRAHLGRMDLGALREHLAAYLLTTYGIAEGSPLTSGNALDLVKIVRADRYAAQAARILSRRLRYGTTMEFIKQGAKDALDLYCTLAADGRCG